MVEIPEHLLKRSKERRAALGLGGGEDAPSTGATESAAPAQPAAAATPAPAPAKAAPPKPREPEPPKPEPVYIQAAKRRQRLPYWAMPVFAALPLWGYFFVRTLSPATAELDPMAEGEALYSSCASCHGGTGAGSGNFPPLTEVGETWPDFRDHMMWVRIGAQDWPGDTYGAGDTANSHTMPGFADLTDQELAQVVLYERQEFGGIEAAGEEIGTTPEGEPVTEEDLLLIAEGELTFADVGLGPEAEDAGFTEEDLAGP